jgi:hypothetical protein
LCWRAGFGPDDCNGVYVAGKLTLLDLIAAGIGRADREQLALEDRAGDRALR